jgi:nitrogen fixation-related uncharacterized protein
MNRRGDTSLLLPLIVLAVVLVIVIPMLYHWFSKSRQDYDVKQCFATQDTDKDGMPDGSDDCKCLPEGVAKVALVDTRSDIGTACVEYAYVCSKVDGRWNLDKSDCLPAKKVTDPKLATKEKCGQMKEDNAPGIPISLKKMVLDADDSPHGYCGTDADVKACDVSTTKACAEAKKA